MYVYIDESGKNDRYVLAAVISATEREITEGTRITRGHINKINKSGGRKYKIKEFKEAELHREYPEIKSFLLQATTYFDYAEEAPSQLRPLKIYAVKHNLKGHTLNSVYHRLAAELLSDCDLPTDITVNVTLDNYGSKALQREAYQYIRSTLPHLSLNLTHNDSSRLAALQTADIIAGTIRRREFEGEIDGYKKIAPIVQSIRAILNS